MFKLFSKESQLKIKLANPKFPELKKNPDFLKFGYIHLAIGRSD